MQKKEVKMSEYKSKSRLKEYFRKEIVAKLKDVYPDLNAMELPALKKIVVSMGVGEAKNDAKLIDIHKQELALITGQLPIVTKAKRAVSNFKLREGLGIGLVVTLRGDRMYEFLDRFIHISAPRIRDFRGFKRTGCDGSGNYSFGITDQQIFPEINPNQVNRTQGMNITFVTSAKTDEQCIELLSMLGFPFQKVEGK
jgi:large subunit ribosomal protein L5